MMQDALRGPLFKAFKQISASGFASGRSTEASEVIKYLAQWRVSLPVGERHHVDVLAIDIASGKHRNGGEG